MKITTPDGTDVTKYFVQQLKGEITREEFMRITGITE